MNTNVEVAHMQDCQSLPKMYFKTEDEQGSPYVFNDQVSKMK